MLTFDEIEDLLEEYDIEWTTLELKREVPTTDGPKRNLAKVVVAFANTSGGNVIIGADNEKPPDGPRPVHDVCPPGARGRVIGDVSQIIESRIVPSVRHRVKPDATRLRSRGVTVLQVSVEPPGQMDPLCYLKNGEKYTPYSRDGERCVPMKPEEIDSRIRELVLEEEKRKAEGFSDAVDRAVDHVLTAVASSILDLGGLATKQAFESALLEGCEGDENVRKRARGRLNNHPLLRRIEDEYDFPNERLRAYYAASDLAQRPSDELLELINDRRYDEVWPDVFTHLVNREVAEIVLNAMIQAGAVERAVRCYCVRRNREVGEISERLTVELLRQARRVLAESAGLQMLFINNMLKDPYTEVRRTVLRWFNPSDYSHVSPSVIVEALLERVQADPNRNCQAAAAEALLQIDIPEDHHFSVAERALAMIESLTTGDDFDIVEDAETWGPLARLIDRIRSADTVSVLVERLLEIVESDREISCRATAASVLLELHIPEANEASVAERAMEVVEASVTSDIATVRASRETKPGEPRTEDLWLPLIELIGRIGSSQTIAERLAELEQEISATAEIPDRSREEWLRAMEGARTTIQGKAASGNRG